MIRVCVICEGQTEETIIRDHIAPIALNNNIYLGARLIPTSNVQKGGGLNYDRVKKYIELSLKEDTGLIITTFFDLYGLPKNFPQYEEQLNIKDIYKKTGLLEGSFHVDITKDNDSWINRFIPHIQPYEFEGLLFTDIEKLLSIEPRWNGDSLLSIIKTFDTPEHINNSFESKPSARIKNELKRPKYSKVLHGSLAFENIGLDLILSKCKHFREWYETILSLNKTTS